MQKEHAKYHLHKFQLVLPCWCDLSFYHHHIVSAIFFKSCVGHPNEFWIVLQLSEITHSVVRASRSDALAQRRHYFKYRSFCLHEGLDAFNIRSLVCGATNIRFIADTVYRDCSSWRSNGSCE